MELPWSIFQPFTSSAAAHLHGRPMKKPEEPDDGPSSEDDEPEKPMEDPKNPLQGGFKPSIEEVLPRPNNVFPTNSCGSVEQELDEVSAKAPVANKKMKNATAVPYYEEIPKGAEMEGKKLTFLKKMEANAVAEKKKTPPPPAVAGPKKKKKKKRRKEPAKSSNRDKEKKQDSNKDIKEKKPKEPREASKVTKKTLGDRLKDKFKAVTNLFSPVVQEKAQKKVQAKLAKRPSLKKMSEGDDAMPTAAIKPQLMEKDDDVWIEDPAVLTNRSHRADLVMAVNNDNNGHLWHDGRRPFWKNKVYLNEIPVAPPENPVSKLLMDVVTNKEPMADKAPDPILDETAPMEELVGKNEHWFQDEQVMSNTIRSILNVLNESNSAEVVMCTNSVKKLTMNEPTSTTTYFRHNLAQKDSVPFTPSPFGKPRKLRRKTDKASPTTSPNNSGIKSSSSSTNTSSGRETVGSGKEKRGAKKK